VVEGLTGSSSALLVELTGLSVVQPGHMLEPNQHTVLPTRTTKWKDDNEVNRKLGPSGFELVGLGATIAGCVIVGLGSGYWLGSATGVGPVMTFAGLAVGLAAAIGTTYSKIRKYL